MASRNEPRADEEEDSGGDEAPMLRGLSRDELEEHKGHGLGAEPILLGSSTSSGWQSRFSHFSSRPADPSSSPSSSTFGLGSSSSSSTAGYGIMGESGNEPIAPATPKKKKWYKRFQEKTLGRFRARLAREAKHRESYPPVLLNETAGNATRDFPDNTIRTSKYTLLSFVPKVLYEQFRKATSIYFLLIVILTAIPAISPISPWTSLLGLLFIVVVAAIREGYEDFLRHRADHVVNQREYERISGPAATSNVRSDRIAVGDLLVIRNNQEVPADCVLIASSDPQGTAFVQTAQLDGETNLKQLSAPLQTAAVTIDTASSLRGSLQCEIPHHHLYQFRAALQLEGLDESQQIPLQTNSLLLRGTFLKNTNWAIGLVAYTGKETKLSLNSNDAPSKFSTLDKRLNIYVVGILVVMTVLSVFLGILAGIFQQSEADDMTYLGDETESAVVVGITNTFSYFILLSYLIPLSMIVSLEIIKVLQSKWMEWDLLMVGPDGRGMTAKTSDLNDELGLVRYIFTDKTGTLTENMMEFAKCSVRGYVFNNPLNGEMWSYVLEQGPHANAVRLFLTSMAVCHNAVLAENGQDFQASSPDEEALCTAARANRVCFVGRNQQSLQIRLENEEPVTFEVLCEFAFNSARRRMSIVVRSPALEGGRVAYLFCKGADTEILARLRPSDHSLGDSEVRIKTESDLAHFSRDGLRTLAFAYRVLSLEETAQLLREYQDASSITTEDRDRVLEAMSDRWERDLTLLGATAIEDKLQPLVPETIQFLQRANIGIWMITGDKQETAINIGYSCGLLQQDMDVMVLNANSTEECGELLHSLMERGSNADQTIFRNGSALVVDGETFRFVIANHDIAFLDLALNCSAVIVCRATPIQKANVVKLVRERVNACCLAIGDGANDVSMIQEANVGVGLYGREGSLAARSSDFALTRFSHLQRLLTVHGRYSLIRNAFVVHYSFYKNAAVFLSQIWFAFVCGFSAQSLYDDWLMTLYNIMITSLPPLIVGIFEKDCPEALLNRYPGLYLRTQSDTLFTLRTLSLWMLSAFYHSLVLAFGSFALWENDALLTNGQVMGLTALGNTVLTVSVVVVFAKAALEIQYWPWIVHLGMWGSLVIYFGIFAIESQLLTYVPSQFNQFNNVLSMPSFWFWMFLAVVFCLLPDYVLKAGQKIFFPEEWEILRERYLRFKVGELNEDQDDFVDPTPFAEIEPIHYSQQFPTSPTAFDLQFQKDSRPSKSSYRNSSLDQPLLFEP